MKKRFAGVTIAALMAVSFVLGGCSQKETTLDSEGARNTKADGITLKWALWDYEIVPYWKDMIRAFEESHPGIKIEYVDLGSNDYSTVLATELSGTDTDLDIVSIKDMANYTSLINKKVIEPLDDYISGNQIDLAKFNGITDQIKADGKIYELPFRSDFWILYYNKDLFDKKGLAYPTNDMTFEEYDELARKAADTAFGQEVYGSHYHVWSSAIQLFGILDGKHTLLDENYNFMEPYYKMVLSQENDGICMKYPDIKTENLHYSAAFSNGNVAMMNMGTWFAATLINNLKNGEYDPELCGNWGMVKYPHEKGIEPGTTLGAITGLAMTSVSSQKNAAWEFIKWASGEEGARVIAETGNFPAYSSDGLTDVIASMDGFPQDEQSKEALQAAKLYLEAPYGDKLSDISSILNTYHDMIMTRECTIEEGIKSMNEEVGKIN